jgi:hypothetical protein
MLHLIDGHNLIPHIPGLSLQQMDDEMRLLELLQSFSRESRAKVEVFFDGAAPGWAGTRGFGSVTAHFVRRGNTADEAIRKRLSQIPTGSGVVVVSSDRQVQAEAHSRRAKVISSKEFAGHFRFPKTGETRKKANPGQTMLNDAEIEEWLQLFGSDDQVNKNS